MPTSQFDKSGQNIGYTYRNGVAYGVGTNYRGVVGDIAYWNGAEAAALGGIAAEALQHAEIGDVSSGNWHLSSDEADRVKTSNLFQNKIHQVIQNYLGKHLSQGDDDLSVPMGKKAFSITDPLLYTAFHSLDFSVDGTATFDGQNKWTFDGTVLLTKWWSFSNYSGTTQHMWNRVGSRLQTNGWIAPYFVTGQFDDKWKE